MAQKLYVEVKPTFSGEVIMPVLIDNGGTFEKKFTAEFKRLSREEGEALQARLDAKDITDAQVLDLVLHGWSELTDVNQEPFLFTPENRVSARNDWPTFEASIVFSFFNNVNPAAIKNFVAPLAT